MIVLYRTPTCPKCKILETKLHDKHIAFTECTDIEKMQGMGITEVPQLQIDGGALMNFGVAVRWVNGQEVH